ncbi:MAG: hypothetical protein GY780_09620 [bacterium]|nr:hypothetical protein [bacterium]
MTVEGVVTMASGTYSDCGRYIQGATGGINVLEANPPFFIYGDRLEVTGSVWTYNQEYYLGNPSFVFMGNEAVVDHVTGVPDAMVGRYALHECFSTKKVRPHCLHYSYGFEGVPYL